MTDSDSKKNRLTRTGVLLIVGVVLLLLCGLMLLWWPYYRNQQAIAEIDNLGGSSETIFVGPDWIPEAINDEISQVFERVWQVNLISTPVSDSDLRHLSGLNNLQKLWLGDTQISDAGLEHLQGLNGLERLFLVNTRVTQAGFDELRQDLPNCDIEWRPPAP